MLSVHLIIAALPFRKVPWNLGTDLWTFPDPIDLFWDRIRQKYQSQWWLLYPCNPPPRSLLSRGVYAAAFYCSFCSPLVLFWREDFIGVLPIFTSMYHPSATSFDVWGELAKQEGTPFSTRSLLFSLWFFLGKTIFSDNWFQDASNVQTNPFGHSRPRGSGEPSIFILSSLKV